jgi:hypothetical protein
MRKIFSFPVYSFVILVLMAGMCDKEEDDCEKNKWDVTLTNSPQPRLQFVENPCMTSEGAVDLLSGEEILFSGTIEKVHCDGSRSERFEYYSTFDPRVLSQQSIQKGIMVGYPITFKFQHDDDYLDLKYSLIITMEGGLRFIGKKTQRIRYNEVREDFDYAKEYFSVEIDSSLGFEILTGK